MESNLISIKLFTSAWGNFDAYSVIFDVLIAGTSPLGLLHFSKVIQAMQ